MIKLNALFIGFFVVFSCSALAFDHTRVRVARELEKDGRYKEALALYEHLSTQATTDIDDQRYIVSAINIALRSLNDKEKAIELAGRIKNRNRRDFVLMSLYEPEIVIEKYKDTDFTAWPEDIRAEAYKNRGVAYHSLKKIPETLADLKKAFELPGGSHVVKGTAARTAGNIFLFELKDEAKAEDMYRKALSATKGFYSWRIEAFLKLTDLLLKQKRNTEALTLYEEMDFETFDDPQRRIVLSRSYSKVLVANDEKLKALEQLNIALQAETKPEKKKVLQAEIEELAEDMLR